MPINDEHVQEFPALHDNDTRAMAAVTSGTPSADDPNATHYDTTEQRVIHRAEITTRNHRDARSLMVTVSLLLIAAIAALGIGVTVGAHYEASLAAATTPLITTLGYHEPHGQFTITVQRINPGLTSETDFLITVTTRISNTQTSSYQIALSASTTLDGHIYVLHCTYNKRYYPVAAVLVLSHPMQGSAFVGNATLYLALGRLGQFTLTPSAGGTH